jgi:hypothetical protein
VLQRSSPVFNSAPWLKPPSPDAGRSETTPGVPAGEGEVPQQQSEGEAEQRAVALLSPPESSPRIRPDRSAPRQTEAHQILRQGLVALAPVLDAPVNQSSHVMHALWMTYNLARDSCAW